MDRTELDKHVEEWLRLECVHPPYPPRSPTPLTIPFLLLSLHSRVCSALFYHLLQAPS